MNSKKFDPNALKRATSIINKLPNSNLHDAPEQPVAAPNEYLDGILTFGPPGQDKTSGIIAAAKEMAVREEAAQKAALHATFDALAKMSAIVATNFRQHGPSDSPNRLSERELNDRSQDKTLPKFIHMSHSDEFLDQLEDRGHVRLATTQRQNQPVVTANPDGTNDSFGM